MGETDAEFSKFDPATRKFLERHRYAPGEPEGVPYKMHLTICGAPNGTLWIGTGWAGLLQFDPRSGKFTQFPHRKLTVGSTKRDGVCAIYSSEPDSDILWLGTEISGLIRVDSKTGELHTFSDDPSGTHAVIPPKTITFIGKESPGVLWVGGENAQLFRFDVKAGRFLSAHRFDNGEETALLRPGEIVSAVRDGEGRIWIASRDAGLAEFQPDRGFFNRHRYDALDPQSLGHNSLLQIYRDRSGVIWVATKGNGVSFSDPMESWIRHHNLVASRGQYSNPTIVQCFHQEGFHQEDGNSDTVWLGSGAGLTRWNRESNQHDYYQHPRGAGSPQGSNAITCFSARRKGGFWIGSQGGLSRYDPATDQMIRVESPPDLAGGIDDLRRGRIRAVHEDQHGEVWIGLLARGGRSPVLLRFNPNSGDVQAYRHDPADPQSIGPGLVTRIHEDRQGRLWFASHMGGKGISRFDRATGRFARYRHDPADPNSLRDDAVKAIHEDADEDLLWIGTKSGLDQMEIGPNANLRKFKHISLGAASDEIFGIEQDNSGNLWLASKNGLRLMANRDQASLDAAVVAPDTASRFQTLNDCYYKLHSGEILIGSLTGFFEIQPDRFQPGVPPPVVITDVLLRGGEETAPTRETPDSESIVVSHQQNKVLSFQFAALDFTDPKRNRYAYRLEGLEDDWHYDSKGHTATYTTLAPGDYVFHVKAASSRGRWNEEGASLAITVLPAWWATWWFRSGAAMVLLGLTAGAVRWRNQSIRQQNRTLALSEQRYVNLLANTSELLWCVEFDEPLSLDLAEMEQVDRMFGAKVVEANEAFARAYNSTLAEVINRWRVEDFLPRSFPSSVPFLLQAVRSRYRMEEVETTERTTDGETKIFVNNFIGTIRDGHVVRIWGMCRDVTESREIEEQIRLRHAAIESSTDGIVIADATQPDLPIVFANERFQQLTGYSSDEALGRNCRFLQGPETDQAMVGKIRKSLSAGERFQGELLNYRKDGSPFWNFLRLSPVRDESGTLTHYVGIITDVTDRRGAEQSSKQQRDELAHVSRAATMVEIGAALAHELSQPLAAILRNAQAARRFLDNPSPNLDETREILTDIVKDDRRAGKVLNRIRQHLNKDVSERTYVNVNEVVDDALSLLHSELIISHTNIDLDLASELPPILGDPIQLQQVVLNLVLNAEDAMKSFDRDRRKVSLSTRAVDGVIEVAVRDSGDGITEENIERIFEPFHTTKEHGMGVGLSISRRIIESHDGKLWAENCPTGGARLVFSLPLHQ